MSRPSLFEKTISSSSFLGIFTWGSREWTLFISLSWAFSRTLVFRLPSILLRSSLSLLQEVCYLLLLNLYPYRSYVAIYMAPFSWHTSVTSLAGLKSPPSLSNVYTRRCDAPGPSETYSTCSCLFFLLEYWLALAIVGRDHPFSTSRLAQLALLEE